MQIRRQRDRYKQKIGMRTIQKRSSDRKTIVEIMLAKNGLKNKDMEGERQYVFFRDKADKGPK
jgi:hypothetical protein